MSEINYAKGDATAPIGPDDTNKIIVHVCNDIGAWGAGFVLAISKRWDGPELAYRKWAKSGQDFELGKVQFVKVEPNLWVANLIGQRDIVRKQKSSQPPIRYDAVRQGLEQVAQKALDLEASIHMPRIGCGLAGGKWEEMQSIVQEKLTDFGVNVTVYDYEPPKTKKRPSNTGASSERKPKTLKEASPRKTADIRRYF